MRQRPKTVFYQPRQYRGIRRHGPWKTFEGVKFASLNGWTGEPRWLLEYTSQYSPAEFEEMFCYRQGLTEDEGLKQPSLNPPPLSPFSRSKRGPPRLGA